MNETCQSALFELNRHWTGPRKCRIGDPAWSRREAVDSYYDSLPDFHSTPLPSLAAWPTVRRGIKACLAVEDNYVEEAVRTLFHPEREDPRIVSGEAGAAGLVGLLALARDANLEPARRKLELGSESSVLVVVTEGATNPDGFREIVGVDSCNGVDETAIGRVEENQ